MIGGRRGLAWLGGGVDSLGTIGVDDLAGTGFLTVFGDSTASLLDLVRRAFGVASIALRTGAFLGLDRFCDLATSCSSLFKVLLASAALCSDGSFALAERLELGDEGAVELQAE